MSDTGCGSSGICDINTGDTTLLGVDSSAPRVLLVPVLHYVICNRGFYFRMMMPSL